MFVDSLNKVDREGLRVFIFDRLTKMKLDAHRACDDNSPFWQEAETLAKRTFFSKKVDDVRSVIKQLTHLPLYIQLWIDTAVATPQKFEFFVLTKANEINSGDQKGDYYLAMQMRHDQLMGLIAVLEMLLAKIDIWISKDTKTLINDPFFINLVEVNIEQLVYLEAIRIYKQRQNMP